MIHTHTHTLLYYSASLIPTAFADRVRATLTATGLPIVSVTQRPLPDFGHNISVGNIGSSIYNCYRQILTGARHITTPYTVCCEDDTLYSPDHLAFTPDRDDTFYYNYSRYTVDPTGIYWRRDRGGMCMCVCSTPLLVQTLTTRLAKYPSSRSPLIRYFSEPGKYESALGLPMTTMAHFTTAVPSLTFNHRPSLGGVRKVRLTDEIVTTLPYWGLARDLWDRYNPHDGTVACTREHTDGGYVTWPA